MMSSSCLTAASQFQSTLKIDRRRPSHGGMVSTVVRCEKPLDAEVPNTRRAVLTGLGIGAAALTLNVRPSEASYGEPAKVFGSKPTNTTGFIPFEGEGYAFLVPSKWNPSAKREFKNVDVRYEDNMYPLNNLAIVKKPSDKSKISDFGPPEKFIQDNDYLLGKQVFVGDSQDGGFKRGSVSNASIIDIETAKDKSGKDYYKFHTITRTADGTEGGSHQLIAASVDDKKNLVILKVNIGDKRWYTGAKKFGEGVWNSFTVA